MITLNVDYSEYSLLLQSLIAERHICKKMLVGENKKSSIYRLYTSEIKRIDKLLLKFEEGSL